MRAAESQTPTPTVGYIALTYRVTEAESRDAPYASECVELGTASCGASIDEALKNVHEATIQYLSAIEEAGERERVFKRRGIPIYLGKPQDTPRSVVARPSETVSVQNHPLANGALAAAI